jgi:hypothetical protein
MDVMEVAAMMRRIDKEEPWFYVEWEMARERRVADRGGGQNYALPIRSWNEGDLHGGERLQGHRAGRHE